MNEKVVGNKVLIVQQLAETTMSIHENTNTDA